MPVINDLYFGGLGDTSSLSTFTVNVLASEWSSTAPYTNTVDIPTEYKDKTIFIYNLIPANGTSATDEEKIAFSYITKTTVTDDKIEFTCDTTKPTVDLAIAMSGSANEALYAIKSMLGNADISRIGDGTLTGALNYIANRTSDIIVDIPTTGWIEDDGIYTISVSKPGILKSDNILYGLYDENNNPSATQILGFKTISSVEAKDNEIVVNCTSIPTGEFSIAVKGCAIVDTNQHGSYLVSMVDQVISESLWTLNTDSGYYEAKLYNEVIKSDNVVDVNFKDESLTVITEAQVLSYTDSYDGYVVIYTKNKPTADVICDYTIMGSGSSNFGVYGIVGDVSQLSTNHKLSIIGAINELNSKVSNLELSRDALDNLKLQVTLTDGTIRKLRFDSEELRNAWDNGLFKYNKTTHTWSNSDYDSVSFDAYDAVSTDAIMTAIPIVLYSILDNLDFLGDSSDVSPYGEEKTVLLRENNADGSTSKYNSVEYSVGDEDISVTIEGVGTVPINDSSLYNAWINGDIKFSLDTWTSNETVLTFNEHKLVTESAVMKAIPLVVKDLIAHFTPEGGSGTVSFDDEDTKSTYKNATTVVTRKNTANGTNDGYTTRDYVIGNDTFTVKVPQFDNEISMNDSCLSTAMKKGLFDFVEGEIGSGYTGLEFSDKRLATEAGVMMALPTIMPSIGLEGKIKGKEKSTNKNAKSVLTRNTDSEGNTTGYSSEDYIVGDSTFTITCDMYPDVVSMGESSLDGAFRRGAFEFTTEGITDGYSNIDFNEKYLATEAGVIRAISLLAPSVGFEKKIKGGDESTKKDSISLITRTTDSNGLTTEYSSEDYVVGGNTITKTESNTYSEDTLATEAGVMKAIYDGIAWSTPTSLTTNGDSVTIPEGFTELKLLSVYGTTTTIDTKIFKKSDIEALMALDSLTSVKTEMVAASVSYTTTTISVTDGQYTVTKTEPNATKTIVYYR